ncbi:50S ribosomal protein L4 [Candidatus Berkelbacteria bacterium]|nr:50S ribosomal protein L4 [Candidatus Berkelbacteria bacterium]
MSLTSATQLAGLSTGTVSQRLLAQVVRTYAANRRTTRAHTLTRGEIRGGGRKPWRQKGTGRARVGSTRSPLWRGGGTTFGPTKERRFTEKLNAQTRLGALSEALAEQLAAGTILATPTWPADGKTATLAKLVRTAQTLQAPVLLLISSMDAESLVVRAARNLPRVATRTADAVTADDVLRAAYLIGDPGSLGQLAARLGLTAVTTKSAAPRRAAKARAVKEPAPLRPQASEEQA